MADEPKKKTWEETKAELIEADVDNFFTDDTGKAFVSRPGFLQKSDGVLDLLQEEAYRACKLMVKESMLTASHAGMKTLRREHALAGIKATRVIPPGAY